MVNVNGTSPNPAPGDKYPRHDFLQVTESLSSFAYTFLSSVYFSFNKSLSVSPQKKRKACCRDVYGKDTCGENNAAINICYHQPFTILALSYICSSNNLFY